MKSQKWKTFNVNCFICNSEIEIKEYNVTVPKKEKYFCSRSCANTRNHSDETKAKISNSLKIPDVNKVKQCKFCGADFVYKKKSNIYCSLSCGAKDLSEDSRKRISEKMKGVNAGERNGMYGRTPTNTKRILVFSEKHTKNKNFYVKSTYEQKYVNQLNDDKSVKEFTYEPKEFRVYFINKIGNKQTYIPDFLVNNKIIEIKNKWSAQLETTKIKEVAFKKQFPNIEYEIISW